MWKELRSIFFQTKLVYVFFFFRFCVLFENWDSIVSNHSCWFNGVAKTDGFMTFDEI